DSFWFSNNEPSPARSTAEMCTNTSFVPSSGLMKPKPLVALKNLTVPVFMATPMEVAARDTACSIKLSVGEERGTPVPKHMDRPKANSTAHCARKSHARVGAGANISIDPGAESAYGLVFLNRRPDAAAGVRSVGRVDDDLEHVAPGPSLAQARVAKALLEILLVRFHLHEFI